jgi:hypothetical protein
LLAHFAVVLAMRLVDNRIRFDINLRAAERAELEICPKLLALARSVRGGHKGRG